MSRKTTPYGLCALCLGMFTASCGRDAPKQPTAHQVLVSYLDHPASVTTPTDSELVIKTVEWNRQPLSAAERNALASIDVVQIRKHWPDPKLRRVTVVFERLRRLGPIVLGRSDTALVYELPRRDGDAR